MSENEQAMSGQPEVEKDKNGYLNIKFDSCPAYPYDPTVGKYSLSMPPFMQPWEYNGWEKETMSWKKTCYISAQLHPNSVLTIKGPDATKFLESYTTPGYENFFVGRIKHAIITDDNGMVQQGGMVMRFAEDEYRCYSLGYWLMYYYQRNADKFNVALKDISFDDFNFQCGGPRVLEMLEDACEEDLHDIGFMRHRQATLCGKKVHIFRFGMAGTLAYEVHGDMADARPLYDKVYESGKKYGVERLGWLSYMCNHGENGFPQTDYHFVTSAIENEDFLKWLEEIGVDPEAWPRGSFYGGSSGSKDLTKRMRNPVWLNWHNCINVKTHDFPGRDIIAKELVHPTMTTRTLVWNTEDLLDVFASWFQRNEEPYHMLQFPMDDASRTPNTTLFQDDVLNDKDEIVGWSSGREYSLYSRDMFSLATLKIEYCEIGTQLYVLWGNEGERQKKVRCTVQKFPHLDLPSNKDFDIEKIPRRWPKKN
jgi:glycine cleavage system aminomethyltransferase T